MAATRENIGVVGLGRMGANIARHLQDEGFAVVAVYDTDRPRATELASELGATACATLADVTAQADTILTVVTDDPAMDAIFAESGDSLLAGAGGRLFINCATVSPAIHVTIEARAERAGAQSLEACMASSIPQARDGTLYLMCAGHPAAFERAQPLLTAMSASLRYVGTAGRAAQVKALVNMVMNINTAGLAEGWGLGQALGLDVAMLREVFAQTRRQLARAGNRRRGHGVPRPRVLLLGRARRQGLRYRPEPRPRSGGRAAARGSDQAPV